MDRRKLLADADKATQRGDFDRAVDIYRRLLSTSPFDVKIQQRLGDALERGGKTLDACRVFEKLADSYWEGGHQQRGISVLKRARKLRQDQIALTSKLAGWEVDRGMFADAHSLLMEAAESIGDESQADTLSEGFEVYLRARPKDVDVAESLVKMLSMGGRGQREAHARMKLARAYLGNEAPDEALGEILASLQLDPDRMTALDDLDLVSRVCKQVSQGRADELLDRTKAVPTAADTLFHTVLAHARGRTDEAVETLSDSLSAEAEGWSGRALSIAWFMFAEMGQFESALSTLRRAHKTVEEDDDIFVRQLLDQSVQRMSIKYPQLADAPAILGVRPDELPSGPVVEPVPMGESGDAGGDIASEESEEAEEPQSKPLPPAIAHLLLEARTLLEHGLTDRASEALGRVAPEHHHHDAYQELRAACLKAKAATAPSIAPPHVPAASAAPAESFGEKQAEAAEPTGPSGAWEEDPEDLMLLTEDMNTGVLISTHEKDPPSAEATKPQPTKSPGESPTATASPANNPLATLGDEIARVLTSGQNQDPETIYQMAVGLVQMGLDDQARPMLELVARAGERQGEGLLELVRLHARQGRIEDSLRIATTTLDGDEVHLTFQQRGEMLSAAAETAVAAARWDDAETWIEELMMIAPDHPSVETLRQRIEAAPR